MSFNTRRLGTAGELKAMAHPLRLDIMEQLGLHGAMTASELGERLGETPANCSWHLRKLAEHGFVEETGDGQGRRRPWRATSLSHTWDEDDPVTASAAHVLSKELVGREVDRYWRQDTVTARDDPLREPLGIRQYALWMTAEEAKDFIAARAALADPFRDRLTGGTERPDGARLVWVLELSSVEPKESR